ncbi:hypothetical protein HNO91_18560 [Pseudomonas corrugata]|uniref:Thymidine phosphorylase n=1 Tax=Pseudomonas corrugata TaxID=47879 RepID=A0A7Y5Z7I5_9PSED|nr:hypothetical protein [Pseudomonas corrugata]NUT88443.1 hypothetical protein [Pseudomonas corrugata]
MKQSAALTLALSAAAIRQGRDAPASLSLPLTAAQSGCALRLSETSGLSVQGAAEESISSAKTVIGRIFYKESEAASILGKAVPLHIFEKVAGNWFSSGPLDEYREIAAGYWLADAFIRGVAPSEAAELTQFLAGKLPAVQSRNTASVRRYPTGGISEKQALILPPIMRALAREFQWCSPFLVAGKLAHTGGTRDKLAVIPGFKLASVAELSSWNGVDRPVRYFSAGADLCPRDAMMYRLRGETGTVADMGLMASSIMSKQIALPADVIILDILFGPTAFLKNLSEAESFGEACEAIGKLSKVKIMPKVRASKNILGRSVGASTEIVEAAEILRGSICTDAGRAEIATSISFLKCFAEALGLDSDVVCKRAETVISNGEAFSAMLGLFSDHGVDNDYIKLFSSDPRNAVLGSLEKTTVFASSSGVLMWDAMAVADIANHQINSSTDRKLAAGKISRGGIELLAGDGELVNRGDPLAIIYGEKTKAVVSSLSSAASIVT